MLRTGRALVLAGCLFCASSAFAGTLGVDGNGMSGYTGSTTFVNGVLHASVDFAVFAPGHYAGQDPSAGADYVYAYQLFNTSQARNIDTFSVGLNPGSGARNATSDPLYGVLSGVAPDDIELGIDDVVADLLAPPVAPGGHSEVILFTSPFQPDFANASILSGGTNAMTIVPSPAPEPTSVTLAALGGIGLLSRRRSRSR
jgi:hypothetical protein